MLCRIARRNVGSKPRQVTGRLARAAELCPDDPEPLLLLAMAARQLNDRQQARRFIEQLLSRIRMQERPSHRLLEEAGWELLAFPEHRQQGLTMLSSLVGVSQHWWTYLCLAVLKESEDAESSADLRATALRLWPGSPDAFLMKESALRWIFEDCVEGERPW